jgi:FtsH-binding integral membrane protein
MDVNQQLMILAIFIVMVVFFVYTRSFTNDVPSCNGYISNVYLYVLLALLLTSFSVLFIAKRNYPITSTKTLLAFAIAMLALFSIFMTNPINVIFNHILWLAFIIAISISVYTIWRQTEYRHIVSSTLIITLLLTVGLIAVVHINPDWVKLSWGSTLTLALLVGLFAWIIPMLFFNIANYYKLLSAVFVFIFMMLILYDTKLLRVKATECTIPNYPKDSIGLFLDVINLITPLNI